MNKKLIIYKKGTAQQQAFQQNQNQNQMQNKQNKSERSYRAITLLKEIQSKKIPVCLKLRTGEILENVIILDIDTYEITVSINHYTYILFKHAIDYLYFK